MSDPARAAGFSLLELLIVTAVIAVLASIVTPNYTASRKVANEAAVVGTLRSIASAQYQFKTLSFLDRNSDGNFEHGTTAEMTGRIDVRTTGERLAPTLLSLGIPAVDEATGWAKTHGYHFALYLPDASGVGMPETAAGVAAVDPVMAQHYWSMLAWPVSHGETGVGTYAVNQSGEIVMTREGEYSGATKVPAAGAYLVSANADRIDSNALAVEAVGADGCKWVPVN